MPSTLELLRVRDQRLIAESARSVSVLDAAFSQDLFEQIQALVAMGTGGHAVRRRGRRSIQLRPSPRNVIAWSIAQRIWAARDRKDWRQEDLAQESGIARANIARLEKGRQIPKVATLRRLASALGLEVHALLKAPESVGDAEDQELAEAGLGDWAAQLDGVDKER